MTTSYRFLFFCALLLISNVLAAQKYTISGYVEDGSSGEKLIAVNIFDNKSASGTITNTYGFYSLTLPKDSVLLSFSYVGYQTQYFRLMLDKDINLNVKLGTDIELETVEVVAEELERIEDNSQMSTVEVPVEQIKRIPALLGEVDVLKALQLLPGVQSGGEGQSGLYVRGGSPDQNLILLDGVPVYNASHLFGFFSVFNADAIKDVKLTKGGFPARYGGRLSSVIEINMKEGNSNEWHGAGMVGIVASKLTVEGPIVKDKTSLILSGRRTYIDLLARPFIKQGFKANDSEGVAGLFFHDVNAKINHKFSEKDRLYFSVYTGRDEFYFEEKYKDTNDSYSNEFGLGWGNLTSALRWNHLWTNKLFSNATVTYSRYQFDTSGGDKSEYKSGNEQYREEFSLQYLSGIKDFAAKIDFDFVPNPNHFIRFGVSGIHHQFEPGEFDLKIKIVDDFEDYKLDTILGQKDINAQEYALYVEDDVKFGEFVKVNAGLHYSGFRVNNKTYNSLQPRLSMRVLLPGEVALKGSYSTMRQYVQLLTNEGIGLPTDLWLPTTERVKPQDSWQAAVGFAKTFRKQYEVSIEGYYKEMSSILSYKEGASLFQLDDWQDRVTQGKGKSYGLEFFVQKKKGRLSGWVGYTLSWSTRQFDDINFGKTYPFKYDRRHDFSIVGSYKINDRIRISATWVYGTGNAITLANSTYRGFYQQVGFVDPVNSYPQTFNGEYYADRNNFRMRAYHRLDFGIDFTKKWGRFQRTWNIGAYNAYSQKNPFFLYVDTDQIYDNNGNLLESKSVLKQASLFPLIPSVSYRFEF